MAFCRLREPDCGRPEEEGEAEQGKARAQGAAVETGETGAQGAAEQAASCYDVILTGNYTKLSFFEPYINWINEEYAAFYRGIIDDLLETSGVHGGGSGACPLRAGDGERAQ